MSPALAGNSLPRSYQRSPQAHFLNLPFGVFFFVCFMRGLLSFFFLRFIQRDTYSTETFGIFIVMYYNYKLKLIYIK